MTATATAPAASLPRSAWYRSILLADLAPGRPAPCRLFIYFPANQKYVQLREEGQPLSQAELDKIREKGLNAVYVATADLPKLYAAGTELARARDKSARLGVTERRHRLEDGARSLLEPLAKGQGGAPADLPERLFQLIRSSLLGLPSLTLGGLIRANMGMLPDEWSRAVNTATYGACFAMALDAAHPVDVAMAALVHDLCEATSPGPGHPAAALRLLEEQGIELPLQTARAIRQHHEREDGKGFPDGLAAEGIAPAAKLLALADVFDDATRAVPGETALSADALIRRFEAQVLEKDPGALPDALARAAVAFLKKSV